MWRCAPLSAVGTFHGNHWQRETARSKERKRARVKYPTTAILSSCGAFVAPRTLTGSNASYSLKAAESAARGAHTRKGTARLLAASRGLSGVINALYRLGKNRLRPNGKHHKLEATKVKETTPHEKHLQPHRVESISNHNTRKASQTNATMKASQTRAESKHHKLLPTSKHHKLSSASEHHKLPVTSLHHLRPARVSITKGSLI